MSKSSETNQEKTDKNPEGMEVALKTKERVAVTEGATPENKKAEEEHQPVKGRAWQIAQLAAQMVSRGGIYGRLENKDWAWMEEFQIDRLKEAIRTAHLILELADRPVDEQVRASTLFEPGVALNAREIAERFDQVGWPNLGETKVRERLREIQQCWNGEISEKKSLVSKMEPGRESAIRKIAGALADLAGDTDVFLTIDDFQSRASNLLQEIRTKNPAAPTSPQIASERLQALHDWCFPESVIERSKRAKETLYRIHELLRFAEEKFEEQIGDIRLRHQSNQISNTDLDKELERANLWLPEPLRARPLESLKAPFNRSAFNSPPTREASFRAYNHHRVVDPALRYPR